MLSHMTSHFVWTLFHQICLFLLGFFFPSRFVTLCAGKAILHTARNFFNPDFGAQRGRPRIIVALVDGWPTDNLDDASVMARESGINLFLVNVAKATLEELELVRDRDFMKKVGFSKTDTVVWIKWGKNTLDIVGRKYWKRWLLNTNVCLVGRLQR